MLYTFRVYNSSRVDLKIESESAPRVGETIVFDGTTFAVTEVRHVVDLDKGFNRRVPLTNIVVLCQEN